MQAQRNITQYITIFAGIVITIIVIIFPLGYFFISYQHMGGILSTEVEINARLITQIISANPELWEFQHLRIQEYLIRRSETGLAEIRRVLNAKNELIVESADKLKAPFTMYSDNLMDSGVVVGRIEIYRSLRPLLIRTGLVALLMLPVGVGIFLILRNLPIRTILQAEEGLRRSEEEAKRLAWETAIMAEIGRIIGSTLDIQDVYERFAEKAHELIPFDRISINLGNLEKNSLTVAYSAGISVLDRGVGKTTSLAGSLSQEVMRTRKSQLLQGEEKEIVSRFPAFLFYLEMGLRSLMSVPLISKDEVIGVLRFRSKKQNAYTDRDVSLAERVGHQIAGAIANTQLFVELTQAKEEQDKLVHELQDALAQVKTLSGFLPICASCKKIRDDKGYWNQIEAYIGDHSEAEFTHSICPECMKKLYPDFSHDEE